ncbi:MAG: LicD family protein [Christensenellales bacterium]
MNLTLDQMKEIELEILTAVDRLCREEGIAYYLAFGTLLGAVRHGGFIPWDDDVDILMPREDYDRFIQVASKLPGHLHFKYCGNTHPYIYDFGKVEDGRTLLIEDTYRYLGIDSGVYIDIFPLDGCPRTGLGRRVHLYHVRFWQELLSMYFADPDKPRSAWKRPIVRFVKRWLSQDRIYAHIEKICRKFPIDRSKFVGYHEGRLNELMPRDTFGAPRDMRFEGRDFLAPEQPEAYLARVYGHWRQLPPEDQRVAHQHSVVRYRH